MKAKFHITTLDDCGDVIQVKAQGTFGRGDHNAQYLAEFKVPLRLARKYTIGQALKITITPGKP